MTWSVAVFAYNEEDHITACLEALAKARHSDDLFVDVILNGPVGKSLDLSSSRSMHVLRSSGVPGRVWHIAHADKSNAINQFLYRIRQASLDGKDPVSTLFFVDAYARVKEGALQALHDALHCSGANGAAAVPSTGRSAVAAREGMLAKGGLHGSLFAMSPAFADRMIEAGIRLPVGLYRGDGLLNSMMLHDLDPSTPQQRERVQIVGDATWETTPLSPFKTGDILRQLRRMVRQKRGVV